MQRIPFAKPFLPPQQAYSALLSGVWERAWLSNQGPLEQQLEEELRAYLELPYLRLTANGTLGLQILLQGLPKGEIITTAFSFIATATAILWQGHEIRFADIDPEDFNIDPVSVAQLITPNTVAIVATHVFGNPCDVDALKQLGDRQGIPVIYDAAHCFGTTLWGRSIFAYGDAAVASLHATKLYHSGEGGFVATRCREADEQVFFARNFGHNGPGKFTGLGINAKMSELHAAMGLCNLAHIADLLAQRKKLWNAYAEQLSGKFQFQKLRDPEGYNGAYFPILLDTEQALEATLERMEAVGIGPRRYFYPSLPEAIAGFAGVAAGNQRNTPVADQTAARILCLPMYHDMNDRALEEVCEYL